MAKASSTICVNEKFLVDMTYFHCYLLCLLKGIVSTLFSGLLPKIADFVVNLGQLGIPWPPSTSRISSHGKSWESSQDVQGQTSFPTIRNYKTYPQMAWWCIYSIYVYYLKISVIYLVPQKPEKNAFQWLPQIARRNFAPSSSWNRCFYCPQSSSRTTGYEKLRNWWSLLVSFKVPF